MMAQQAAGYQSEDEDSTHGDDSGQTIVQDPAIWIQQDPSLMQNDWDDHVPEGQGRWRTYIPSWSRPGYDDNIEVNYDGTKERPRRGDFWSWMRPALLPSDPRPTQYAQ